MLVQRQRRGANIIVNTFNLSPCIILDKIYAHSFEYIYILSNVLGGRHVSDFKSLNDSLLLNYLCFLFLHTVLIWKINVMLCYVMLTFKIFLGDESA